MLLIKGQITVVVLVDGLLQINGVSMIDSETALICKVPLSYFNASCGFVEVGLAFA
jgi:hypothetical protein